MRLKNILILGASSKIGEALSQRFSADNTIILSGRNEVRLKEVAKICMLSGASTVYVIPVDLAKNVDPIININLPIHLIIDVASASSSLRDSEIDHTIMGELIQADFLSRARIYSILNKLSAALPDIIFISSVLACVKTPNRSIYSSLKNLSETFLNKLRKSNPDSRILIYRVGKQIDKINNSLELEKISSQIERSYLSGTDFVNYGFSGKILLLINQIHPKLASMAVIIQRMIKI